MGNLGLLSHCPRCTTRGIPASSFCPTEEHRHFSTPNSQIGSDKRFYLCWRFFSPSWDVSRPFCSTRCRVSLHHMSQDVEALIDLGFKAYGRGDNTQAARWWRMAAAQRRSDAMVNLGLLVNNPADRDEATQWFFRAALLGNTDGMLLLSGILQEQGDHAVAQNWLQKAAALGDPRAVDALTRARNTPRRMETDPKHGETDQLDDLTLVD